MRKVLFGMCAAALFATTAHAELDTKSVKENVAKRVQAMTDMEYSPDKVSVYRQQPVKVEMSGKKLDLYAVRVKLEPAEKGQKEGDLKFLVDASGNVSMADIKSMTTGRSVVSDAMDEINRVDLPDDFGDLLTKGNGDHEVVFVSDPFCPYCRKAFEFLLDRKERFGEFRTVHMPLEMHNGADAVTWAVKEAEASGVDPMAAMKVAYRDVAPIKQDEKPSKVLNAFLETFPALAKKWDSPEDAYYYLRGKYAGEDKDVQKARELGVTGTPGIFIDGVRVKGFDQNKIADLLG